MVFREGFFEDSIEILAILGSSRLKFTVDHIEKRKCMSRVENEIDILLEVWICSSHESIHATFEINFG